MDWKSIFEFICLIIGTGSLAIIAVSALHLASTVREWFEAASEEVPDKPEE